MAEDSKFNVLIATIDRVLNRRQGVRAPTIAKVEAAIRELNYQPDRIAARLARSREYRFCFVLPVSSGDFFMRIADEVRLATERIEALPNRFERRTLAQSFYDSHVTAHEDTAHPIFRRITAGRDPFHSRQTTYCFLFMEESRGRDKRRQMLYAMCLVARDIRAENHWVVGVATEKHLKPTCSYDFVLLHHPTWPDEMQK